MEPVDPHEAKAALRQEFRQERRVRTQERQKPTAAQVGLAIAALCIGVLTALSAVPACIFFDNAGKTLVTLFAVLPFAVVSVVLGVIGRGSAMGVAGLALGFVAIVETAAMTGYLEYSNQKRMEAEERLAAEERLKAEAVVAAAEEERRKLEVERDRETREAYFRDQERKREHQRQQAERAVEQARHLAAAEEERRKAEAEAQKRYEEDKRRREEDLRQDEIERQRAAEERDKLDAICRSQDLAALQVQAEDLAREVRRREEISTQARSNIDKAKQGVGVWRNQLDGQKKRFEQIQLQFNTIVNPTPQDHAAFRANEASIRQEMETLQTRIAQGSSTWALENELAQAQQEEIHARDRYQACMARIAELGPTDASVVAAHTAKPGVSPTKIYILKSGERIEAVKAVDFGDSLTIKDTAGVFNTVKKADIKEVLDP